MCYLPSFYHVRYPSHVKPCLRLLFEVIQLREPHYGSVDAYPYRMVVNGSSVGVPFAIHPPHGLGRLPAYGHADIWNELGNVGGAVGRVQFVGVSVRHWQWPAFSMCNTP